MARLIRNIHDSLSEVAKAAQEAERICLAAGAQESQALRIGLALDELAANALVHGREAAGKARILVEVWADEADLTLRVRARGPHFDPRDERERARRTDHGGRGLTLVRAFARSFHYERDGDMNVTTFVVAKTLEVGAD